MADRHATQYHEPCSLLAPALEIALQAGRAVMGFYGQDFSVEEKADNTPLTEADLVSHELIRKGLRNLTRDLPILTEESGEIPFEERSQWRRYWLVDPLDGTREFIRHSDEFTVNIALIDDGEPLLGIVHAPALDRSYYACRSHGAYRRNGGGMPVEIRVRRWRGDATTVVCGRSAHRNDSLRRLLERLGEHDLIYLGSALKSCLVAEGGADLYARFGPTSEWDTAAAQCIVEEAGGRITDTAMRTLRYNQKRSLLNPHFLVFGATDLDWSEYL